MSAAVRPSCRRAGTVVVALALALGTSGCAALSRAGDLAPNGLSRDQDGLRRLLASGRADSALVRLTGSDPVEGDALLRTLQAAVAAVHAGDGARAADLFQAADPLLEERLTPSVSKQALSLVSSDRTLPWQPSPTERLLIPYYAARARLSTGDFEGAAVEARRLSAQLERIDEDDRPPAALEGALRLFAGSIFEAARERNDAIVAFRHASNLLPTAAIDTFMLPQDESTGEVVVIVEQGFVAHRVPQSLNVLLAPWERRGLVAGDASAAGLVAARVLAASAGPWAGSSSDFFVGGPPDCLSGDDCDRERRHRRDEDKDDWEPYLLRIAWPALRRSTQPGWRVPTTVTTDAGEACSVFALADVTDGVAGDFADARAGIVARALLRGVAKLALTKVAEKEVSEKDETAGEIVGMLVNAGTALLEQADTRSWHLVPDRIVIARVRLPAGEHRLRVSFSDGSTADLGTVTVSPGVTFHAARFW